MIERARQDRRTEEAAAAGRQSMINDATASSHPSRGTATTEGITLADLPAENALGMPGPIPKVFLSGTGNNSPVMISGTPKSSIPATDPHVNNSSSGGSSNLGPGPLS